MPYLHHRRHRAWRNSLIFGHLSANYDLHCSIRSLCCKMGNLVCLMVFGQYWPSYFYLLIIFGQIRPYILVNQYCYGLLSPVFDFVYCFGWMIFRNSVFAAGCCCLYSECAFPCGCLDLRQLRGRWSRRNLAPLRRLRSCAFEPLACFSSPMPIYSSGRHHHLGAETAGWFCWIQFHQALVYGYCFFLQKSPEMESHFRGQSWSFAIRWFAVLAGSQRRFALAFGLGHQHLSQRACQFSLAL